ncbi:site-specific integrase [Enterococcus diestrammenae]|uniref:site-specific integrase n=1 Tax=Enterococcus diestrammenae TaxID=1155073 RepID=UPI002FDB6374
MAMIKQYIKKNGEKAWYFKTYLGKDPKTGKKVYTTKRGFKTQKEAKIAEARLQTEYAEGLTTADKPKTFQQVYDQWIIEYEKTVRGSTLLKTTRIFKNQVLDVFGDYYITEITPLMLQQQMDKWSKEYVSATKFMNYTGLVFKYAVRFGLIDKNPTDSIIKPKTKKKKKEDDAFYEKENLKLFLECLDRIGHPKSKALFRLLAMTGMRKQEALALTWNDIDFEENVIDIHQAISRDENGLKIDDTKTVGSTRIISVDSKTLERLLEWKSFIEPPTNDYLIFGHENAVKATDIMSMDTPRKWLLDIQDEMDRVSKKKLPRITTHGFRHTHASLLIEMGATLKDIQYRLGHEDIGTTMNTYAHISKASKEKLASEFDNFIDF